MKYFRLLIMLACLVPLALLQACNKDEKEEPQHEGEYKHVFIFTGLAYNDLSSDIRTNLEDLCTGDIPYRDEGNAVLAFMHNTAGYKDYSVPNPPRLIQIYKKRKTEEVVLDTLKTYPSNFISASAQGITNVLTDVKDKFPSKEYGLLLSSHATGWIPVGYTSSSEPNITTQGVVVEEKEFDYSAWPATRSVGAQNRKGENRYEIDIQDFAKAIPMKLDYIIFDACLMGGIEVAWELKNVCDHLVVSPTEVLAAGMSYTRLTERLFDPMGPKLEDVCRDYFNYYDLGSEDMRYATISLIDEKQLDDLCDAVKAIRQRHSDEVAHLESRASKEVQPYFYDNKRWFYDLRDWAVKVGADEDELFRLDAALAKAVVYHAETPTFFSEELKDCCGLSTYISMPNKPMLNSYHQSYAWSQAIK